MCFSERGDEAGTRAKVQGHTLPAKPNGGERLLPLLTPKPLPPPSRGRGCLGADPRPVDSSPEKRSEAKSEMTPTSKLFAMVAGESARDSSSHQLDGPSSRATCVACVACAVVRSLGLLDKGEFA